MKSSTRDRETSPASLANMRMKTGTKLMRIARATDGSRPETTPRMTCEDGQVSWVQCDLQGGHCGKNEAGVTYRRNVSNPGETRELLERIDLGDDTHDTDGDSPEDDEDSNEEVDDIATNDRLPPGNVQVLPDDLLGLDTDVAGRHVQRVMVGDHLERSLGIRLGVKLDEDRVHLLEVSRQILGLGRLSLGHELVKLGTTPFDGVDLLSNKTQRAQTMARAHLVRDPARGEVTSLDILRSRLGGLARLLGGLDTLLVDGLEQLDLALLELHGRLVTLLDNLVEILGLSSNPYVLDRIGAEDLAETRLIQKLVRDGSEEHGPGRDALGVAGGKEERLAKIDVEDALAGDHVHDEAIDDPAHERVREEAVGLGVDIDVTVRDALELALVVGARGVDGEQHRPGDAHADKGHRRADSEEAKEQVGVETLMLQRIGIGDLPEGAEPVEDAPGELRAALTVQVGMGQISILRKRGEGRPYFSRREPR